MNELLIRSTTREPKSHWLTSKYLEEDTQPITKAYKDTSKKLKGLNFVKVKSNGLDGILNLWLWEIFTQI